jgi:hypothetical protein
MKWVLLFREHSIKPLSKYYLISNTVPSIFSFSNKYSMNRVLWKFYISVQVLIAIMIKYLEIKWCQGK